MVRNTSVPDSL